MQLNSHSELSGNCHQYEMFPKKDQMSSLQSISTCLGLYPHISTYMYSLFAFWSKFVELGNISQAVSSGSGLGEILAGDHHLTYAASRPAAGQPSSPAHAIFTHPVKIFPDNRLSPFIWTRLPASQWVVATGSKQQQVCVPMFPYKQQTI